MINCCNYRIRAAIKIKRDDYYTLSHWGGALREWAALCTGEDAANLRLLGDQKLKEANLFGKRHFCYLYEIHFIQMVFWNFTYKRVTSYFISQAKWYVFHSRFDKQTRAFCAYIYSQKSLSPFVCHS